MNLLALPWLECAVAAPLSGVLPLLLVRRAERACLWCLVVAGLSLACATLAWLAFHVGVLPEWSVNDLLGSRLFALDTLSAPLFPAVALLHFLAVLATARTKMGRLSFGWLLAGEAVRLATFACVVAWPLVGLLLVATAVAVPEYLARGQSPRVYLLHAGLFAALLLGGMMVGGVTGGVLLAGAMLVRCGVFPAHGWIPDLFERASFATALLAVTPLTGVYAGVRLVLPVAPDWLLQAVGVLSLVTAFYAAGLATVQTDARRFFAYLFLSHASLVLIGLELHTPISLTGALCLWFSVMLSLGGLGLTLRALEARFGRLALREHLGLFDHSPELAVCFLLTGLASVGFPGTLGFISAELLIDGAVEANLALGIVVVVVAALNGIAVLRAYLLLFTGKGAEAGVPLGLTARERLAVLALATVIFGGGVLPQPGVETRYRAAAAILAARGEPATAGPDEERRAEGHTVDVFTRK
jgi:NADH-quinone oxidoreductase subunit M